MSSPESYCPMCFCDVAGDATRCPNPECGAAFVRCRNTSCSALLAADAKFCADCGQPVEPGEPPPPHPEPASAPVPVAPPDAEPVVAALPDISDILRMFEGAPGALPGTDALAPGAAVPQHAPAPVAPPARAPARPAPEPDVRVAAPPSAPAPGVSVPVTIQAEYQTPTVIKKGQQAFLRVQARAPGARDVLDVRVEYQCGLFNVEPARAAVAPGAPTAFAPVRFVAAVPGADTARVTVTANTGIGAPVGRWTGDVFLTVEDDAKQALQITNTGGGDVVMYGAPQTAPANPLAGLPPVWKPLPLAPDPLFQRRVAALRKPTGAAAPTGHPAPPGQALVVVEDRTTGVRTAVAVVRGPFATIGRGGKPDTSWWVQGEPLNKSAHLNVSGLHLALDLRDGYAWGTDRSSRGTRLNGAALPPKEAAEAVALADGDEIFLADGFRVRVGLAADADGVGALWLARTDAHAGRLAYALVARALPVPVFGPGGAAPLGWLAWTSGPGGAAVAQFRPADGASWTAVPADQPTSAGPRFRVGWRAVPAPRFQELDLNPNPPIL